MKNIKCKDCLCQWRKKVKGNYVICVADGGTKNPDKTRNCMDYVPDEQVKLGEAETEV